MVPSRNTSLLTYERKDFEIDLFPSTVSFDLRSSLRMKAAEPPAFRQPFSRCILCNAVLSPESVVLLACGSFNPITIMHLRMMELARDEVERSRTLPRSTNCTKGENACSGLAEDTSSIDVSSCTEKADFSCPNSVLPWNQSVLCGVLSPVSDTYAKSDLAPSSARIELARLACQFHSDWLAVDMWEATQPEWVPTRLVVDHLQLVLDRVWFKLIANESFTYTSVVLPNQPPVVPASNGQLSPQSRESAHVNAFDGLFSESWLLNCIKRTAQITGCSLCRKIPSTLHNARSTSSSASCEDADSISSTSHEVCCRWYPRPRIRLVFGADIIQSFQVPNLWTQEDLEHLLGQYGIICISRPGCDVSRLISDSELLRKYKSNITLVQEWFENNLSSSLVRRSLKLGQSVLHLVPQSVLERIYALKLYGAQRRQQCSLQAKDQCSAMAPCSPATHRSSNSQPHTITTTTTVEDTSSLS